MAEELIAVLDGQPPGDPVGESTEVHEIDQSQRPLASRALRARSVGRDARPFAAGSGRSNWSLSFERADRARAVLEKNGLRPGQISGVFAHGATALMKPDEPFAPENRRLSILAVRRGLEKMAARGQPTELTEPPKEKPTKREARERDTDARTERKDD